MMPKAIAATRWQQKAKTVMARGVETVMAKGVETMMIRQTKTAATATTIW